MGVGTEDGDTPSSQSEIFEYIAAATRTSKIIRTAKEKLGLHGRRCALELQRKGKLRDINTERTSEVDLGEFLHAWMVLTVSVVALDGANEYVVFPTT